MIFDFQEVPEIGGIVVFPDVPYSYQPLATFQIRETAEITGSSTMTGQVIQGTVFTTGGEI